MTRGLRVRLRRLEVRHPTEPPTFDLWWTERDEAGHFWAVHTTTGERIPQAEFGKRPNVVTLHWDHPASDETAAR